MRKGSMMFLAVSLFLGLTACGLPSLDAFTGSDQKAEEQAQPAVTVEEQAAPATREIQDDIKPADQQPNTKQKNEKNPPADKENKPKADDHAAEKAKTQEAKKPSSVAAKPKTLAAHHTNTASKPAPSSASDALNPYEREVVRLVNVERQRAGLKPLEVGVRTSKAAEMKSEDMMKNNYFSHQSPTYGSPFDLLASLGVSYRTAGENIAAGQRTPAQVVDSWMNSPGHRANIMNPSYDYIGVGYVEGGTYGTYWTQVFVGE